jgi:SAM-dependent methyltransferase
MASSDPASDSFQVELARIHDEYVARRQHAASPGRYSVFNAAALAHMQGVERALLTLLKRRGVTQLADKRILDVGCGGGYQLRRFLDYGALPGNLFGVDILDARIEKARAMNPAISWRVASGHELPFVDSSFDIVMCFTVMSSVLDPHLRERVAAEMRRVRALEGVIICHDFMYSNPRNPSVIGISPREARRLFTWPGSRMATLRVTLAPPVARVVTPHVEWLGAMLERLGALNTHMVTMIY